MNEETTPHRRKTDNTDALKVAHLEPADWRDRVISEVPLIKLITAPKLIEYEVVSPFVKSRWEVLAQVNGCYARIETIVTRMEQPHGEG